MIFTVLAISAAAVGVMAIFYGEETYSNADNQTDVWASESRV